MSYKRYTNKLEWYQHAKQVGIVGGSFRGDMVVYCRKTNQSIGEWVANSLDHTSYGWISDRSESMAEQFHRTVPPSVKGMMDWAKRNSADIKMKNNQIIEATLDFIDSSKWQAVRHKQNEFLVSVVTPLFQFTELKV